MPPKNKTQQGLAPRGAGKGRIPSAVAAQVWVHGLLQPAPFHNVRTISSSLRYACKTPKLAAQLVARDEALGVPNAGFDTWDEVADFLEENPTWSPNKV